MHVVLLLIHDVIPLLHLMSNDKQPFGMSRPPNVPDLNFCELRLLIKMPFLLLYNLNDINCGHVRKFVMRSIIFWTIYL